MWWCIIICTVKTVQFFLLKKVPKNSSCKPMKPTKMLWANETLQRMNQWSEKRFDDLSKVSSVTWQWCVDTSYTVIRSSEALLSFFITTSYGDQNDVHFCCYVGYFNMEVNGQQWQLYLFLASEWQLGFRTTERSVLDPGRPKWRWGEVCSFWKSYKLLSIWSCLWLIIRPRRVRWLLWWLYTIKQD